MYTLGGIVMHQHVELELSMYYHDFFHFLNKTEQEHTENEYN